MSLKKDKSKRGAEPKKPPNILLIMADEYRSPRYDADHGMKEQIKNIVGFREGETEDYAKYFPGFMRLRQNSVVLEDHTIAASACIPSRAAMFTGQYGTRTEVKQTDGVFKEGTDPDFAWLDPDGVPTMGDWFSQAGYDTYYFGKCHFADPPDHSLEKFGFAAWESSYPEPHGTLMNNLGFFRDQGFADLVTTFLRGKGLALDYDRQQAEHTDVNEDLKPWFAVASFTNPHDITTWPVLAGKVDPEFKLDFGKPLKVPKQGSMSNPPEKGTWRIPLNPDGFPQDNSNISPTFNEDLTTNNKPDCHHEYTIKLGIALASKTGNKAIAEHAPGLTGLPFHLTDNPEDWALNYMQYYTYLHYVVDKHIDRILKTLDETGLADNTIVIFVPDHGESAGAHGGMLQKWHQAYQETVQVPVVFSFPPDMEVGSGAQPRQISELSSHIDLLPTLLGLAGIGPDAQSKIASSLEQNHHYYPLVGADLSKIIYDPQSGPILEPNAEPRQGVLFITDDMITEPVRPESAGDLNKEQFEDGDYDLYLQTVHAYKQKAEWKEFTGSLTPGSIVQPCHVAMYRERDWKLVRYAPHDGTQDTGPYQWELYYLPEDNNEEQNLLIYDAPTFTAHSAPKGFSESEITQTATELYDRMKAQIQEKLMKP